MKPSSVFGVVILLGAAMIVVAVPVSVKNERTSKQLAYVLGPPVITHYGRESGGGFGGFNIGFGQGGFGIGFGQEGGFGGNRYPNYRPQGHHHHHHHHHHQDYSDEYY